MTSATFESDRYHTGDRTLRPEYTLRKLAAKVFQWGNELVHAPDPPQPIPKFHGLRELAVHVPRTGNVPPYIALEIDEVARGLLAQEQAKLPLPNVAAQTLFHSSLDTVWCALLAWDATRTDSTKELVEFELKHFPGNARPTLHDAFTRALESSNRGTFDDALEQAILEQRQAA